VTDSRIPVVHLRIKRLNRPTLNILIENARKITAATLLIKSQLYSVTRKMRNDSKAILPDPVPQPPKPNSNRSPSSAKKAALKDLLKYEGSPVIERIFFFPCNEICA
jgi:hypothetical protein